MATYVTGDIHGEIDIGRHLSFRRNPSLRALTEEDRLVICGDFGLVWSEPPSGSDRYWLDWLEARPWGETCWLDGNHENFDLIERLPVSMWRGGRVQRLPGHPSVIHLMRGETYEVDGNTWWVMGGAMSNDRRFRTEGKDWWPQEIPSAEERAHGLATLAAVGFAPDYVFTHDCPWRLYPQLVAPEELDAHGEARHDPVSDWMDEVDARLDWSRVRRWYFGHHHQDVTLEGGRYVLLYGAVVPLGETV